MRRTRAVHGAHGLQPMRRTRAVHGAHGLQPVRRTMKLSQLILSVALGALIVAAPAPVRASQHRRFADWATIPAGRPLPRRDATSRTADPALLVQTRQAGI